MNQNNNINNEFQKSNSTLSDNSNFKKFKNINVDEFDNKHKLQKYTSNNSEDFLSDSNDNLNYSKNKNILEIKNSKINDDNILSSGYTTNNGFDDDHYNMHHNNNNLKSKTEELINKMKNTDRIDLNYDYDKQNKYNQLYENKLPTITLKKKKSVTFKGASPAKNIFIDKDINI